MSTIDPEIATYNQALVAVLRATDPSALRRFAKTWGDSLGNAGLKQLAKATPAAVERRMWMMIYDRPDLEELHDRAEAWFEAHEEPELE